MRKMELLKGFLIIVAFTTLVSCTHNKNLEKTDVSFAYNQAMRSFNKGDYGDAAKKFEKIDENFSFSEYSAKSEIMAAYSYYMDEEYEDSLRMIDYFMTFHPLDKNISYIYYLRAMNYYDQIQSVKRSQDNTKLAYNSFNELIMRFPNSKYVEDSKAKMGEIKNHLAGAEMYIGRTCMKRGHYIRALTSFNQIIIQYHDSRHIPEAYYRILEAYISLGMYDEAEQVLKVLRKDYPTSRWLTYAEKLMNKSVKKE